MFHIFVPVSQLSLIVFLFSFLFHFSFLSLFGRLRTRRATNKPIIGMGKLRVDVFFSFLSAVDCFFSSFNTTNVYTLAHTADVEKSIANEIVNNEINVENDVTKKLAIIMENHIGTIQKQKRTVTKLMQDNESAKHKYQVIYILSCSSFPHSLAVALWLESESKIPETCRPFTQFSTFFVFVSTFEWICGGG